MLLSNLRSDVKELGGRVIQNETKINSTISHVSNLTSRIEELENKPDAQSEYILSEVELRLKSKSNVIIFGLPESIKDNTFNLELDISAAKDH